MKKLLNSIPHRSFAIGAMLFAVTSFGTAESYRAAIVEPLTERPQRLRQSDREAMRQEHEEIRELGQVMERIRDEAADQGEDITIEEVRQRAEGKLRQAAKEALPTSSQPQPGVEADHASLVCFRSDGSVTDVRDECDFDQGKHFGRDDNFNKSDFESSANDYFVDYNPTHSGPPILSIVSEALQRLNQMQPRVAGTDAEAHLNEVIAFLGGVLAEYAVTEPESNQRISLAQEIHRRLQDFMSDFGNMPHDGTNPMPGMGMPDSTEMLTIMDCTMKMAGQIIIAFDEHGLAVTQEARAGYQEASQRYQELRDQCEADKQSCMGLGQVMQILETKMRPSMEQAMMTANNSALMETVMAIAQECDMHMDMDRDMDMDYDMDDDTHMDYDMDYESLPYHQGPTMYPPDEFRNDDWQTDNPCKALDQWSAEIDRMRQEMTANGLSLDMIEEKLRWQEGEWKRLEEVCNSKTGYQDSWSGWKEDYPPNNDEWYPEDNWVEPNWPKSDHSGEEWDYENEEYWTKPEGEQWDHQEEIESYTPDENYEDHPTEPSQNDSADHS